MNTTDAAGNSALLLCCETHDVDAVKILVERNSNVNICNAKGQTPLVTVLGCENMSEKNRMPSMKCVHPEAPEIRSSFDDKSNLNISKNNKKKQKKNRHTP